MAMTRPVRVRTVQLLGGYRVRLAFTDETTRDVDLDRYLRGPVFDIIRKDRSVFEAVCVDPQLGTIVWPNGADIDPDVLYHGWTPEWMESREESTAG
jgi:hypothetical protein